MVILTTPFGQTSNRLFQHVHIDSFCRENGISFYNKYLQTFSAIYPNIQGARSITLPGIFMKMIASNYLQRIFSKFGLEIYKFEDGYTLESNKSMLLNRWLIFCEGWGLGNHEITKKYRPYYQKLFTPGFDTKILQDEWLFKVNSIEKIVAIHIRRGDYAIFEGGRYFYDDRVYLGVMHQAMELLGGNCRFIIFSNDVQLQRSAFTNSFPGTLISVNNVATDHYLMSQCDYIIGPPSTFSLWASYIGATLYYHMHDKNPTITLHQFDVCNG